MKIKKAMLKKAKKPENIVINKKTLDVLNYTPIDYKLTRDWAIFSDPDRFDVIFRKKINELTADEMCGSLYDALIITEGDKMKVSADEQRVYHNSVIQHHKGLLEGELVKLNKLLGSLKSDLEDINNHIERLKSAQSRLEENHA